MGRFSSSSSDSHGVEEKLSDDAVMSHSMSMAPFSPGKANGDGGKINKLLFHLLSYISGTNVTPYSQ